MYLSDKKRSTYYPINIETLSGKKKKYLYNAINIVTSYYITNYDIANFATNFSELKLKKSIEFISLQKKFLKMYDSDTKDLEKKLKTIDNPEEIINLINNYKVSN